MTITFRTRPLTTAETAAGWASVLVPDQPTMKPVYLAHAGDVATFADSPMAVMMARVMGATFVVET